MRLKVCTRVVERSVKLVLCGAFGQRGIQKLVSRGWQRCGKGAPSGLVCLIAELDSYC